MRHALVGGGLVLLGLLANKWLLERHLASDGRIEGFASLLAIGLLQVALVGSGLAVLWRRPRAPSRANLLLAAGSLAVGCLLGEAAARIAIYNVLPFETARAYLLAGDRPEREAYSPHHYLDYALTPGYRKGRTTHSSLGFRGPELALAKPSGSYRIAALGGSTTYTVAVEDDAATFPARLEQILSERFPDRRIEVLDAGVPDYTSWESLVNFEFRVLDFDPDLAIVYHGVNDVQARLVEPARYRGDNSGLRKPWSAPSIAWWEHSVLLRIASRNLGLTRPADLIDMVDASSYLGQEAPRYRQGGFDASAAEALQPILDANPPVFFRRNLVSLVGVARAHGVAILLATWAWCPCRNDYAATALYQAGFEQNNAVVRSVAADLDVPLLDFAAAMPREERYWHDGRHVNEAGALLKARLFADFIADHFLTQPAETRKPATPGKAGT